MAGARLITAQETENDLREAKIKSVTGGDEITRHPLNGVHIRFKPAGKKLSWRPIIDIK
jgi:phage/plasmid-associated DNA primase